MIVEPRLPLLIRRLGFALIFGAVLFLARVLTSYFNTLPSLANRSITTAYSDTSDTHLGKAITPLIGAHPGQSGIYALTDARDAFAARMHLANAAERSLDVQYYIWRGDMSGTLLFDALGRAARRGVRVRLLLDDNGTSGLDAILAALDKQPNMEVRLFNPFVNRTVRMLGYITDFPRLNRRMHNKSFTADNQATIIGGRNVGDEYFDADRDLLFVDLDALAIGPVVDSVSKDFDRYWNSASAYPALDVIRDNDASTSTALAATATRLQHDPAAQAYIEALAVSPFIRQLLSKNLEFEWERVAMVSDDPSKGLGLAPHGELLWTRLKQVAATPRHSFKLVSPYFVPGAEGVKYFSEMAASGVEVAVLTNSLHSTDVAAVHAGYAKRRKALLEAGVKLFETKRSWSASVTGRRGRTGSSGASLHAKTFSIDDLQIFIGSFNFDPRSARLNTEMGFVIDSPTLAVEIRQAFASRLPESAYEVRVSADGGLRWIENVMGKEVMHSTEPGTTFWQRLGVSLISVLPIEWLL